MKNGSLVEKVISFPRGPIRRPTRDCEDPETQRKLGILLEVVVIRELLGRTSSADSTQIPAPT